MTTCTLGLDCPTISSTKLVLRSFARSLTAYTKARDRFNAFTASLDDADRSDPSPAVAARLDRLECDYEAAIRPMLNAQGRAIDAMKALGGDVNGRGVRVDGRLFLIVQDEEAPEPWIVIAKLDDAIGLE